MRKLFSKNLPFEDEQGGKNLLVVADWSELETAPPNVRTWIPLMDAAALIQKPTTSMYRIVYRGDIPTATLKGMSLINGAFARFLFERQSTIESQKLKPMRSGVLPL